MSATRTLSVDLAANAVAFGLMGVGGIILQLLIGRYYGAEMLGVFNQLFAVYIFSSQLTVFGVQFSVLKHVAEHAHDRETCRHIVSSAVVLSVAIGIASTILLFLVLPLVLAFFDSAALLRALPWAIFGALLFGINKVLLNAINGLRHMFAFAVLQTLRIFGMLATCVTFIALQLDGGHLAASLLAAEALVFLGACIYLLVDLGLNPFNATRVWLAAHWQFGVRGVLAGSISEINTRIDVLVIGLLASDTAVGLYSLAATLAEGLAQSAIVIRNIVNPIITRFYTSEDLAGLRAFLSKTVRRSYAFYVVAGLAAMAIYPLFIQLFLDQEFSASTPAFNILVVGTLLVAGYLPLDMLLVQIGRPWLQTRVKAIAMVTNLALNLALVSLIGIIGAALATAVSYLVATLILRRYAGRELGFTP